MCLPTAVCMSRDRGAVRMRFQRLGIATVAFLLASALPQIAAAQGSADAALQSMGAAGLMVSPYLNMGVSQPFGGGVRCRRWLSR